MTFRIIHVLDHSLPLHSGYTFRTRAIMKAQVAKGWHVAGVTSVRHIADGPSVETVDGLTFYRTPKIEPAAAPFGEWREIVALSKRLAEVRAEFKPDLIHAHSPVLTALGAMKSGIKSTPFLYEIRAFWEDAAVGNGTGREGSLKYHATKAIEGWVAKRADAVAVICEGLRGDLIKRGVAADKIMVSPNGVDLELFGDPTPPDEALRAELGLQGAETIGFIGSFYDYEGLDDLIAAMPMLVAARPNLHLLMVGGGPVDGALRAAAQGSSAANRIHFVGRVPHQEVERYYSLIDVLVYPRKKMRLTDLVTPLKPLEAMAQMKLVAASDVGGHRELISDGITGTLFKANDPVALAKSVAALFADRASWPDRLKTAREYVEQNRNWSSNISRYEPVYRRLIGTTG
jgi:PEP-CTERM/exosortase A-associated glycosyltransferase